MSLLVLDLQFSFPLPLPHPQHAEREHMSDTKKVVREGPISTCDAIVEAETKRSRWRVANTRHSLNAWYKQVASIDKAFSLHAFICRICVLHAMNKRDPASREYLLNRYCMRFSTMIFSFRTCRCGFDQRNIDCVLISVSLFDKYDTSNFFKESLRAHLQNMVNKDNFCQRSKAFTPAR